MEKPPVPRAPRAGVTWLVGCLPTLGVATTITIIWLAVVLNGASQPPRRAIVDRSCSGAGSSRSAIPAAHGNGPERIEVRLPTIEGSSALFSAIAQFHCSTDGLVAASPGQRDLITQIDYLRALKAPDHVA